MMGNVPKEVIDEAAKHDIVPGAVIRQFCGAYIGEFFTVEAHDKWECFDGSWVSVGKAKEMSLFAMREGTWATVFTPAPAKEEEGLKEEGLKEGDACECGPAMRAAIVELAEELGLGVWKDTDDFHAPKYCLYWNSKRGYLAPRYPSVSGTKLHAPEAFITKMRITAKRPKIDDKPVQFGTRVEFEHNDSTHEGRVAHDNPNSAGFYTVVFVNGIGRNDITMRTRNQLKVLD